MESHVIKLFFLKSISSAGKFRQNSMCVETIMLPNINKISGQDVEVSNLFLGNMWNQPCNIGRHSMGTIPIRYDFELLYACCTHLLRTGNCRYSIVHADVNVM